MFLIQHAEGRFKGVACRRDVITLVLNTFAFFKIRYSHKVKALLLRTMNQSKVKMFTPETFLLSLIRSHSTSHFDAESFLSYELLTWLTSLFTVAPC